MKRRVVTSPFVVRRSSFVVGRLIECWKTDCTSVAPLPLRDGRRKKSGRRTRRGHCENGTGDAWRRVVVGEERPQSSWG